MLGDAPAVDALQARHEPVRPAHVAQVVDAQQQAEVAAVADLVELDHAGREVRQLRLGRPARARRCAPAVSSSSRSMRCKLARALPRTPRRARSRSTSSFRRSSSSVRSRDARLSASRWSASMRARRPAASASALRRVLGPAARRRRARAASSSAAAAARGPPRTPGSARAAAKAARPEAWRRLSHGRQNRGLPSISFGTGTPKYFSTVGPMSIDARVLLGELAVRDEQARDGLVVEPAVVAAPLARVRIDDVAGRRPAERGLPGHAVAVRHAHLEVRRVLQERDRCRCRRACRRC